VQHEVLLPHVFSIFFEYIIANPIDKLLMPQYF
jgi:hypothetical protein